MSEVIKLETDIPIPVRPKSSANKYPWGEMKVGDSFLIPRVNGEVIQLVRERATKAIQWAKRTGHKYCTRASDEGVRVWRIE